MWKHSPFCWLKQTACSTNYHSTVTSFIFTSIVNWYSTGFVGLCQNKIQGHSRTFQGLNFRSQGLFEWAQINLLMCTLTLLLLLLMNVGRTPVLIQIDKKIGNLSSSRCVHACQNWQKLWSLCFLPRARLNIIRPTRSSTEDPNTFAIYYTSHYAHYCGDTLCNWYLTSKVNGTRILSWRPETLATGNGRPRASITARNAHAHSRSKAAPHSEYKVYQL